MDDLSHSNEQIYQAIYQQLDPTNSGVVASGRIVEFLKSSGVPLPVLGAIWEEADYQKRGTLDRRGVFIALKLVAAVQNGHPPVSASLSLALPPPRLGAFTPSVQSSPAHSVYSQWGIGEADQAKYDSIFDSLCPENGKLGGDKVRPVLMNSGLNPSYLAKIWELADQDNDGFLDRVEMQVALHLVYRALQGEVVPRSLPNHLIHPSKAHLSRRNSIASMQGGIMGSRAGSVTSLNELSQYTPTHAPPSSFNRPYSVQAAPARPPSLPHNEWTDGGISWDVKVAEHAETFSRLDQDRDGLVTGGECAPLLMASRLPQEKLAHLWSLVDIEESGMLSIEQFALLVHLTRSVCNGEEMPSVLPPSLIPPSLRGIKKEVISNTVTPSQSNNSIAAAEDDDEAKALVADIEKLEEERRKADDEMAELEKDMKAKQSLMKQLQVELKTLESTVKQLEKQKGEANKRLGEMDEQKNRLLGSAKLNEEKAEETRKRMAALMEDTNKAEANKEEDAARVNEMMRDVHSLEQETTVAEGELRRELQSLEETVGELSRMERESVTLESEKVRVCGMKEDITSVINQLNEALANNAPCSALSDDFSRFSLSEPSTSHHVAPTVQQDAFGTSNGWGAPSGGGSKVPPPRPAPPSAANPAPSSNASADPFANADPFSGVSSQSANSSSFADFANFGAFS